MGEEEENEEAEECEDGNEVDAPVGPERRRRRRQAARLRGFAVVVVTVVDGGRGGGAGGGGYEILSLGIVLHYERLLFLSAMAVELRDRRAE